LKVYVETYGCTMNQGEGRTLQRMLASLGHEAVSEADQAELVVLNTCTVIGTTERKMFRRMEEIVSRGQELAVTGCMAKVQADVVIERFPGALVLPPEEYHRFPEGVAKRYGSQCPVDAPNGDLTEIVPIAQGCLGHCTYCITRLARGRLRSYDADELVANVRRGIGEGCKEFLLTAQDTAAYGRDAGTDLVHLMKRLLEPEGDHRFRLGMMNPNNLAPILDRFLDVLADARMYKFLHLPVQSGSDRILTGMARGYRVEEYISMIKRIRERFPGITISTDVIVGFPGETEEDHRATIDLLDIVRPDIVNVTRFSPRPMTPAANFEGRVHGREVKARSREITELRFRIAKDIHRGLVGEIRDVLVTEEGKGDTMIARTDCYCPVVIPSGSVGERLTVRIVDYASTHLFGEPLDL
jgi:threonylcarbamoyladenosine tRNA methylthiotransferase CDKAL1